MFANQSAKKNTIAIHIVLHLSGSAPENASQDSAETLVYCMLQCVFMTPDPEMSTHMRAHVLRVL